MGTVIAADWRELNATQRDILTAIALNGPTIGIDLAEQIGGPTTRQTAYRALRELEEMGYVERVSANERKSRELENRLTMDGLTVVRRGLLAPAARINERDTSHLTTED